MSLTRENGPEAVLTAMVTPFAPDERVDREGTQALANHLVNNGSDGLVLAGTTGESPTLSADEQLELFDVVREVVGDEVPLVGGTGSNSTREAVEMTREATERGSVNAILAVSPYYNRPSQFGLRDYYQQLAGSTDLPIILYNIPVRTGRAVELDTIRQLADDGAIRGLKDATGNTEMARTLSEEYGDELLIYSGDDSLNLEFARAGAIGAISVASHWAGEEIGRMFTAYSAGDEAEAERISALVAESCEFESSHGGHDTPNPIPTKVMMAHILGLESLAITRSPMLAEPSEIEYLKDRAQQVLAALASSRRNL